MADMRTAAETRIVSTPVRAIKPAQFWAASRRASDDATGHAARQDFASAITAKTQELINLSLYRAAESAKLRSARPCGAAPLCTQVAIRSRL